jgi:hypothetical protein
MRRVACSTPPHSLACRRIACAAMSRVLKSAGTPSSSKSQTAACISEPLSGLTGTSGESLALALGGSLCIEDEDEDEEGCDKRVTSALLFSFVLLDLRYSCCRFRLSARACSSRTIRRLEMAPILVRLPTPFRNSSSMHERFSAMSPPIATAMSSTLQGLPPVANTPRSSHSNIRHIMSIHTPFAAFEQRRRAGSFIQSPG